MLDNVQISLSKVICLSLLRVSIVLHQFVTYPSKSAYQVSSLYSFNKLSRKKVIRKHNVYAKGNYLEKNYLNNLEGTEKQQKGGLQIRFWKVQHEQGACQ